MRKEILTLPAIITFLLTGCTDNHLIPDKEYRLQVEKDFTGRRDLAKNRNIELFSVFNNKISAEQEESLKFLFAYMPLSDLADYTGEFFLANANAALKSRKEMPWGKTIPENIFLHYVLPLRVNNENLDSFRIVYYDELSARIKGMDAMAAALEINHWCHEKVTYHPADIRTSGPMSTILSARGRCGEESTFTVSALRTAGLPARQVYTPRWAHSDDNHAWVEVWINGNWHYMGACEPEPVPDRGWFTETARRAMLVHTRSFGAPSGDENTIISEQNYSIVNNLSKYAPTKTICVRIVDAGKKPLENAIVEFQLYNYAEFYPLASVPSDSSGICRFETGLGDLMIWARKGNDYNYCKISVNEVDTVTLVLDRKPETDAYYEYDLGVPVARTPFEGPPEELIKANSERLVYENKIRQEYIDTWIKPEEAASFAGEIGADAAIVQDLLRRSMGNFRAIMSFLRNAGREDRQLAVKLLTLIADKDLRDTPENILTDHLSNSFRFENAGNSYDENIYYDYVLNPRIDNELIVSWRKFLFESLDAVFRQRAINDPSLLTDFTSNHITINESDNYYKTPLTPAGVEQLRIADIASRKIYFVALCRTLGIPGRLEPGSRQPQFYQHNKWHDVYFSDEQAISKSKGFLKLTSGDREPVPEYYIHFTIARFDNGRYNTLEYDYNRRITDFRDEIELLPGNYMLVTGNRISDSKILASVTFFDLKPDEHKTLNITLRKDKSPAEVFGRFDLNSEIRELNGLKRKLKDLSAQGVVLTWIEPDKEPTKHIFNDLMLLRKELDSWGGWFVFLSDPEGSGRNFNPEDITKGLPVNSIFASDSGSELLKLVCGAVSCSSVRLPLMVLLNPDGEIIFKSEGYRIGIGEQILRKLR